MEEGQRTTLDGFQDNRSYDSLLGRHGPVKARNSVSPVFIISSVRSGSTLLRNMLDSHPEIVNPGECDFLFDQLGRSGEYPDVLEYQKWLSTNRIFLAKNLVINQELSYLELVNSFVDQLGSPGSCLTLNVHRNFELVPGIFPEAKYVHLLRDPRGVARSCVGIGWTNHAYFGVDRWIEAERSWELLESALDDSAYMEVRYENLILDTEQTLTSICEFLGKPYSVGMMDYAENSTYELPDQRLVNQWEKTFSERELRLVEGKIENMIVNKGYEPSGYPSVIPGKLEKLTLALRNKLFIIKRQIVGYGLFLYVAKVISNRVSWSPLREYCQKRINQIVMRGLK